MSGRGFSGRILSRRVLLGGGLAAGVVSLAPMFDARAGALAYDLEPRRIADGVWVVFGAQETMTGANGGAIANVAILDTRDGAVVIDTGPSKKFGEALHDLAKTLTGKDVVRAYLTHFHPDHVFGNQAFGGSVAATQGVTDGLKASGEAFASAMYANVGDWMRDTEVSLPEKVATGGVEEIGGRKLRLIELKGHTASDLVIVDETSGVMFAGDLVFLDRAPTTPHADLALWRGSLRALSEQSVVRLVPGHGPAEDGTRALQQTRDWLDMVEETIRGAFERGADLSEALSLPLPTWTDRIALARYEFQRTVMHLYPRLEAELLPRAETIE